MFGGVWLASGRNLMGADEIQYLGIDIQLLFVFFGGVLLLLALILRLAQPKFTRKAQGVASVPIRSSKATGVKHLEAAPSTRPPDPAIKPSSLPPVVPVKKSAEPDLDEPSEPPEMRISVTELNTMRVSYTPQNSAPKAASRPTVAQKADADKRKSAFMTFMGPTRANAPRKSPGDILPGKTSKSE